MSLLQLQAQFDTLQAQVNPHFLYNVLNVISSRGIMDGDEEIVRYAAVWQPCSDIPQTQRRDTQR